MNYLPALVAITSMLLMIPVFWYINWEPYDLPILARSKLTDEKIKGLVRQLSESRQLFRYLYRTQTNREMRARLKKTMPKIKALGTRLCERFKQLELLELLPPIQEQTVVALNEVRTMLDKTPQLGEPRMISNVRTVTDLVNLRIEAQKDIVAIAERLHNLNPQLQRLILRAKEQDNPQGFLEDLEALDEMAEAMVETAQLTAETEKDFV